MKALGYNPMYATARCILHELKSPRVGIHMFSGYLSSVQSYSDIKKFVSLFQIRLIFKRFEKFYLIPPLSEIHISQFQPLTDNFSIKRKVITPIFVCTDYSLAL